MTEHRSPQHLRLLGADAHEEGARRFSRGLWTGSECTPLEFEDARRPLSSVASLMLSVVGVGLGLVLLVYASALLAFFR